MSGTLAEEARRRKPIRNRFGLILPRLVLMTDRARLADPLGAVAGLPSGSAVILRDAGWPGRIALGRALRKLCRQRRLIFLVAGDERLAIRLGADGVHWPEVLARRRRRLRRLCYVSAAAHSLAALVRARRAGADWAVLSPVFPTQSHPGARTIGPVRFSNLGRSAKLPVMALGGIAPLAAQRLRGSALVGYAAIDALS